MAITVFSKKFSREVDALQYFSLIGHNVKQDQELNLITDIERSIVRDDISCPSCGVTNAIIVSGAKGHRNSPLRQPHFRFIDENGNESHDDFCDLKTIKPFKDETSHYENFNLNKSNTDTTRIIGKLISSALSNNIIKVSDIIGFRQWHFNIKKNNIVYVDFSPDKLHPYLVYRCRGNLDLNLALSPTVDSKSVINKLALDKIVASNKGTLDKILQQPKFKMKERELDKFFKKGGKSIFDVRKIIKEYYLVNMLGNAMLDSFNCSLRGIKDTSALQAYCGLLLYVNEWSVDSSIEMCNKIINCKVNESAILGNIIGLNPFYKFELYSAILDINEVQTDLPSSEKLKELIQEAANSIVQKQKI
jgi:hypothetical protein